ncbi:DUF2807 domain-containing protein [Acetobacter sacchari]|uniref:DUF2807 domain-containing protein n=1 Tax=Acetobacter sacchari TaxID=2661687 RepID=A0ABS3LZ33_9PROT|nr:DUF2807 domain-containing protein [Acetobacter sacchari]MBO1361172.1 DUF2807 domain-containing protein [Acetobacter sacchari]
MVRGLVIVIASAAALSALCFGLADLRGPLELNFADASDDAHVPVQTKAFPWKGGPFLSFDLPGEIIVTQGETPSVVATGSKNLVDSLSMDGDILKMERKNISWPLGRHGSRLRVTVTAPALTHVVMNGFGSVNFRDYQQKELEVELNGAGSLTGTGKVADLTLKLSGAGSAKFTQMIVANMDVSVSGAGSVKAGPTGVVNVSISGAGSVSLTSQPQSLSKQISGVGSVSVMGGAASSGDGKDNDDKVSL